MNRKDLLVAGGVGLVLSFGWYQFAWQSQGKSETKAASEAKAAKESVSKLTTQIAGLERTRTELEAKAGLVSRIDEAIPATPELSALVKQLQATASARNVALTSISTGKLTPGAVAVVAAAAPGVASTVAPAAGAPPSEMSVTLALHGAYPAIVAFVNDLSGIPRLVVVDSLSLARNEVDASVGGTVTNADVSATITAKVFSTATPAGTPGAAAPAAPTTIAPAGATTTAAKGGL